MAKATHSGICQICGCRQKLPSGTLAKHGYTTKWGFFSGVCHGSGHLPYEKSVNLIQESIDSCKNTIINLESMINSTMSDTENVWVQVYFPSCKEYGRVLPSVTKRVKFAVADCEFSYSSIIVAHPKTGNQYKSPIYGCNSKEQMIFECNLGKATVYQREINQRKEYITMQEERLASWVEKELTPV